MTTSCNLIQESKKPITKPKLKGDICTIKSDDKDTSAFCTVMGRDFTDNEFNLYVSDKKQVKEVYTRRRVFKTGIEDINKFKCIPYELWYKIRYYINNQSSNEFSSR